MKIKKIPCLYITQTRAKDKDRKDAKKALKWEPTAHYKKLGYSMLKSSRFIFFNKKKNYAYCSDCDSTFEPKKDFKHKGKAICPKCKKEMNLLNINLFKDRKRFISYGWFEFFQKGRTRGSFCCATTKLREEVVIHDGMCERTRTEKPGTVLVILPNERRVRFKYFKNYYDSFGYFSESDSLSVVSPIMGWFDPRGLDANEALDVDKKALQGTKYQKYLDALGNEELRSDLFSCFTDEAERLYKAGYGKLGENLLWSCMRNGQERRKTCDVPDGRTPKQMIGLHGVYLDAFKMTCQNLNDLKEIALYQEYNLNPEKYVIKHESVTSHIKALTKLNVNVGKALKRYSNHLSEYEDYIELSREYNVYANEKQFLYPTEEKMLKLHDEYVKRRTIELEAERKQREKEWKKQRRKAELEQKKREAKESELIEKYAKMLEIFEYKDEKYLIRPLKSVADMRNESEQMNHCIRTYTDRYANKICSLFTIRNLSEPEKPICSVEIRYGDDGWFMVQSRAKCNADPDTEVKDFIKKWMALVADICKRKENQKLVKRLHKAA